MNDHQVLGISHSHLLKPMWKAIAAYMIYFGTRYVSNDIKYFCGNFMDHSVVKTFTIFCIAYQATEQVRMSLIATLLFAFLQYYITYYPKCKKK
jgi:uncharacterized membrane protein